VALVAAAEVVLELSKRLPYIAGSRVAEKKQPECDDAWRKREVASNSSGPYRLYCKVKSDKR